MKPRPLMAALSAFLIVTCGSSCGGAHGGPEPIPLDRVNCARCGMLISSDANAAQSQTSGQTTKFFDDVGCLAPDEDATKDGVRRYVRASDQWVAAEEAWFARSATARTPMDYGILAFATADGARAADRDGQARQWPAIVALAKTR